jgi:5'(3')-deoxyribonucleotidase
MKRICIDMDDVLADTLSEHLARYNRDHSEAVTKADLTGKWLWEVVSIDLQERLQGYLHAEDFFEDLPVIEDSQRVVRELSKEYEIYIATAAMEFPNSFGPKYRWLRRHFPYLYPTHFVFCGDKSILNADYLVDDQPLNFRRFKGEGILFTAPHNIGVSSYRRVDSWQQVGQIFMPNLKID